VFPSLPEQSLWDDYQKTRQALVGGLMNGAPGGAIRRLTCKADHRPD
jgi:hypothetical protein